MQPSSVFNYVISAGSISESRRLSWHRDGLWAGSQEFRPAPEPNQPPVQWVLEVKRPVIKPEHSTPASAEVKNSGAIPPLPHVSLNIYI
jgi:hypothetical protein